jgi:hypothetical protein
MQATASTLVMVRTVCCQGHKTFGQRCAICPHRPENRQNASAYKREAQAFMAQTSAPSAPGELAPRA